MTAAAASLASSPQSSWRDLYLQALFETDRTKALALISEAEKALVRRECELFSSLGDAAEREAINNALHALHALRGCIAPYHACWAA